MAVKKRVTRQSSVTDPKTGDVYEERTDKKGVRYMKLTARGNKIQEGTQVGEKRPVGSPRSDALTVGTMFGNRRQTLEDKVKEFDKKRAAKKKRGPTISEIMRNPKY